MQSPTFMEIWDADEWMEYFYRNAPVKTREYFKFRSTCRMIFWIPLTTTFLYMVLLVLADY